MRAENSLLLLLWFHYSAVGFDKKWSNDYIIVLYFIQSQKKSPGLPLFPSLYLSFLCWQSNLDRHTCYNQMSWFMRSEKEKKIHLVSVFKSCVCVCLSVCGWMCIFVCLCLCVSVSLCVYVHPSFAQYNPFPCCNFSHSLIAKCWCLSTLDPDCCI